MEAAQRCLWCGGAITTRGTQCRTRERTIWSSATVRCSIPDATEVIAAQEQEYQCRKQHCRHIPSSCTIASPPAMSRSNSSSPQPKGIWAKVLNRDNGISAHCVVFEILTWWLWSVLSSGESQPTFWKNTLPRSSTLSIMQSKKPACSKQSTEGRLCRLYNYSAAHYDGTTNSRDEGWPTQTLL
jgi:hypothetical protein